jgi:AraC-like DNA-binding protein
VFLYIAAKIATEERFPGRPSLFLLPIVPLGCAMPCTPARYQATWRLSDALRHGRTILNDESMINRWGASPKEHRQWIEAVEQQCGMECRVWPEHSALSRAESSFKLWFVGAVGVLDKHIERQTWTPVFRGNHSFHDDGVFVKIVTSGSVVFRQHGHDQLFGVGSIAVIDPLWTFDEHFEDYTRVVALKLPKRALRERGFVHESQRIIVPDVRSPDVSFVRDFLLCMAGQLCPPSQPVRQRLGQQCLDLMDVILHDPSHPPLARSPDATLLRAKGVVARRAGDVQLTVSKISAELNISPGYLNRLFASEGTSVMRYLFSQRLKRAEQLLKQTPKHRIQIQEIAFQCGFSSAAHFSRLFKQHYGITPRDVLNAAHSVDGGTARSTGRARTFRQKTEATMTNPDLN